MTFVFVFHVPLATALAEVNTFCTREPYYKNNFGVFLCVIVYRLFVLNFWWHRHREYQLVAKSTVPCFFIRVIFTMSVFPLWYTPAVPRNWGHSAYFGWGHAKKKFRRFAPCPKHPSPLNRFSRLIRQTTRFRAIRMCLFGVRKQKFHIYTP